MLELLSQAAGVLSGIAVMVSFLVWLYRKFAPQKAVQVRTETRASSEADLKKIVEQELFIIDHKVVFRDWKWEAKQIIEAILAVEYDAIPDLNEEREGTVEHWISYYIDYHYSWSCLATRTQKIVGHWYCLGLTDDAFELMKNGRLRDTEVTHNMIHALDIPGIYKLYVMSLTILDEYRSDGFRMLFDSLVTRLTDLAQAGVYFDEVCVNAYTEYGKSLCKTLGMKFVSHNYDHGDLYTLTLLPLPNIRLLARYPVLLELYRQEQTRLIDTTLSSQPPTKPLT